MNAPDETVVEKIRKLLRITDERGATKDERDSALMAAQRLALRHSINLDEVDAREISLVGEPIISQDFRPQRSGGGEVRGKLPIANKFITWILARYFSVEVLTGWTAIPTGGVAPRLSIIGRRTNVEIAIYVYGFLYHEFQRRWREYKQTTGVPMSSRSSFYNGLYQGLCEKLDKTMDKAKFEAQAQLPSGTSMAMVLQGEREKVEARMKELHPLVRYVKQSGGNTDDWSSLYEGRRHGRTIEIKPALTS